MAASHGAYVEDVSLCDSRVVSEYPVYVKNQFIRKVYSLLSLQLLFTVSVSSTLTLNDTARIAILNAPQAFLATNICMLFVLCPLFAYRRKYPLNMSLLALFTCMETYSIAYICSLYFVAGDGSLILGSLGLASFVFGALSLYAHFSNQDFSWMGGFLFIASFALVVAIVVASLFSIQPLSLAISFFGCLLFSGYILYDTSTLIHRCDPDEYVVATIELYLDFINLFLYVLEFLNTARD